MYYNSWDTCHWLVAHASNVDIAIQEQQKTKKTKKNENKKKPNCWNCDSLMSSLIR